MKSVSGTASFLALACALTLSACGGGSGNADPTAPQEGNAAALAPAATLAPVVHDRGQAAPDDSSVPLIFRGHWGGKAGCGAGLPDQLTIEPRRIVIDGRPAPISYVELQEPGVVAIDIELAGTASTTKHSWDLRVADDGSRLDRIEGGIPDAVYTPCPVAK